ncbi:segregation/condensation protein A [Viridibacillus sp. FSL R5-0477]|uniref:Segregation and condensation protein A n=1 Tax=Viridibacillus arenosi FSL R5-213 TaxID=1227360 RepID=W4ELT9_9BACL|nr:MULTISPECIES: segregation/condensation protein A [Viridibacillus]ETT81219.1 segregation and condensation protein A [Viridibacillus arenosi FSL R5-213]OMC88681.1 segregation/condensation protein A [Viridibacillus sp. FSL H7-0596]OMC93314.1 segregation/condensation protein A [Viridibacillus arenosi]
MSYEVKLEAFEGPLDLLLHLIHRLEIDIYDIPMAELTAQYMEHIRAMQVLELNEASEYLVMAASLLAIKSKMLLPIHEGELDETEFDMDEPDPREELVARLIEYRKFKDAAVNLKDLESSRAQYFTRPPADLSAFAPAEQLALFETSVNVFDMVGAFQKMLRRKHLKAPLTTKITRHDVSIKDQMKTMMGVLKLAGGRSSFFDLFPYEDKSTLVITFLSLLELMKRQIIAVEQNNNFEDLTVILRKEDLNDEQLESIDEQN